MKKEYNKFLEEKKKKNEEITKIVAKQKELGFHIITDGEFRRIFKTV